MEASNGGPPYSSGSSPTSSATLATGSNYKTANNGPLPGEMDSSDGVAPGSDIIAFEVIFSIVLFLVIASCYAVAIRRRRRKKREAARLHALLPVCTDSMLERAYARNERPIHSIIQGDPPPYSPPDSTLRLPDHAVTRLSNALLRAHTTTMQERPTSSLQPSMLTSDFPPKYSDLQSTAVDERRDSLQSMLRAPSSNHNDENNTDERHPSCYTTTTGLSNSNQQRTR